MALLMQSRIPYNSDNPYRPDRPQTKKIIFLSMEGSVTEEEYFKHISNLFNDVKTRIQFVSVAEDAVNTFYKMRTQEQAEYISKVRPKQLVERIDQFKIEREKDFQFDKYPEDEFWIVTDVDKNWSQEMIDSKNEKTYKDEWNEAIAMCESANYKYAISNPFFEIWLLLHHDEANEEDKQFAVTNSHEYEKTEHFRERLRGLGAPLKKKKHINESNYNKENIRTAIERAKQLHLDKTDLCPQYFATTVYLLLEKIMEILPEGEQKLTEME